MEIQILGPIEVVKGRPVPLGGPKLQTLLAVLAVHAGRVVSAEQLIDAVWGSNHRMTHALRSTRTFRSYAGCSLLTWTSSSAAAVAMC